MGVKEEAAAKMTWSPNEITCKVIETGTPSYDRMTNEARGRGRGQQFRKSTLLYDALALIYNDTALGNLLVVDLPNRPSPSNLRKTIENRGVKECDYRLFRPTFDEHGQRYPLNKRPLVLQRISDQKMRTVQEFTTQAEAIAKEAAERGTSNNNSQPENQ
ncbi:hypothetical protein [Pseudomonas sp. TCU-HL1]|uniref:hypothetical protein n=1 Tax=Pseudomonas sp. TCU-HL1 TaxID=1856685 RepID=UPI00083D1F9A|nr:hypothetical protein [Pseudomonas sp. TCU-HL1]AOE86815.1 hypothetical protein THL1_4267 [Pseudomonas sp. TCU-HL1]